MESHSTEIFASAFSCIGIYVLKMALAVNSTSVAIVYALCLCNCYMFLEVNGMYTVYVFNCCLKILFGVCVVAS